MKRLLALFCLLPIAVWGVERNELDKMLAVAATNQSADYVPSTTVTPLQDSNVGIGTQT